MSQDRVMLLIDADNLSVDVIEQAVRLLLNQHGGLHVRRAYCTAESAVANQAVFKRLGIKPMVNLAAGKNSTDIAMAVDAIDLVLAERPDVVVIASSDSDFAPLVHRLREKGCVVRGIGQLGKTGDETQDAYDDFTVLEHHKSRSEPRARPARKTPARKTAARTAAPAARGSVREPVRDPVREAVRQPVREPVLEAPPPVLPVDSAAAAPAAAEAEAAPVAARKTPAARKAASKSATGKRAAATKKVAAKTPARKTAARKTAAAKTAAAAPAAAPVAAPAPTPVAAAPATPTPAPATPAPAPARSPAPAPAAQPDRNEARRPATSIDAVLACLPELAAGQSLKLNTAVQRLREAQLLGRNTSSLKLFALWPGRFDLLPAEQPTQVRLRR